LTEGLRCLFVSEDVTVRSQRRHDTRSTTRLAVTSAVACFSCGIANLPRVDRLYVNK
jgi:hypothetical protein